MKSLLLSEQREYEWRNFEQNDRVDDESDWIVALASLPVAAMIEKILITRHGGGTERSLPIVS